MPFNISEFSAAVKKRNGFNKPSHFVCLITPPSKLINESITKELIFFCDSAQVPAINIESENYKSKGYGIHHQVPNDITFDNFVCTFLGDSENIIHQYFLKWLQLVFNFNTDSEAANNGVSSESFNYYDDYTSTVSIMCMNGSGETVVVYELTEAYVKGIGALQYGWEQNDVITRFPVYFNYKTMKTKKLDLNNKETNNNVFTSANTKEITNSLKTKPNFSSIQRSTNQILI